jgi:hypothetical protein
MSLMTQDDFSRQLSELDKIQETCKNLLATKHYQKLGEEGIHAVIARAKALNIHPFEALNGGFHVVNGKVGMSTEMMAALVRQRGHSIKKDPKSNSECVILHGKRADNGDEWTCKFDKEDAMAAGLWGGATWKKYPQVMLYNRCMSMLFRQLFPDLSLGAGYVEDELKEITRTGEYQNLPPLAECEVKNVEKKEEPKSSQKQIEKISMTELNAFCDVLKECSPQYIKDVDDKLKEQGINEYFNIPKDLYEKLLPHAIRSKTKFKSQQMIDAQTGELHEEAVNE